MPTMTAMLTLRQEGFILDMLREVFPTEDAHAKFAAAVATGAFRTRQSSSAAIEKLIERRDAARRAAAATAMPVANPVPAGHYALRSLTVEDGWEFYKVVDGKGRWEGRTFVNRFRSDYLDRLTVAEQRTVLGRIAAAGADQAGADFAHELECCRRCARTLTDIPTARKNGGWGPECVKKIGA